MSSAIVILVYNFINSQDYPPLPNIHIALYIGGNRMIRENFTSYRSHNIIPLNINSFCII